MTGARSQYVMLALAAAVAVLATLLVTGAFRPEARVAFAQTEGVGANYVIGILGQTQNDRTPLVLLDTKAQNILIYEYVNSRRKLYLRVARSFVHDRELEDASFGENNVYEGPSVRDVQELLRRARPSGARPPY